MDKLIDLYDKSVASIRSLLSLYHPKTLKEKGLRWSIGLATLTLVFWVFVLSIIWGQEPEPFDVRQSALQHANLTDSDTLVTGYTTAATLRNMAQLLLDKPGGYLSNDIMPPGVLMDNMPNWEFGVLVQIRDLARSLRNDMSRSQTQSTENKDLAKADPKFSYTHDVWILPATEGEYADGIKYVDKYLATMLDPNQTQAQFFTRADNLHDWLSLVEKRLGSLSQRLSASVGQIRVNTDLAGDAQAKQSTPTAADQLVKTPWLEIDDVFYESRGSVYAIVHFLKAVEIDFKDVLEKKNAVVSLRQIIRELESTQQTIWSPMVMNGRGFGFSANYSLVMASYIARANAALIELRSLLVKG